MTPSFLAKTFEKTMCNYVVICLKIKINVFKFSLKQKSIL